MMEFLNYILGGFMRLYKLFKRYRNSENINIEELKNLIEINKEVILLDVRSPQEYKEGHLDRSY